MSARDILRQMKSLGKLIVKDDIGNLDFSSLKNYWQYGAVLWYTSEMLMILDFFFPLDKQIEKARLKNEIIKIKQLQEDNKNAEQQLAQNNKRIDFRGIRRRHT